MAPDLVAACVDLLRKNAPLSTALGESASTPKIMGDTAQGQPALPYLVFGEPMERREYSSGGNYIASGQLQMAVYAYGKETARSLADQAARILNDPVIAITGQRLMKLRVSETQFVPSSGLGPGEPTTYQRVVTFDYMISGALR